VGLVRVAPAFTVVVQVNVLTLLFLSQPIPLYPEGLRAALVRLHQLAPLTASLGNICNLTGLPRSLTLINTSMMKSTDSQVPDAGWNSTS
jgi:hypothetical protein